MVDLGVFSRIWRAGGYARAGWIWAYCNERAFRQEIWITFVIVPISFWVPTSGVGHGLLIASWIQVLVVELLNSAIEKTIDRFSEEHHELAGRAKDMASGAVLLSFMLCGSIWACVLWAH